MPSARVVIITGGSSGLGLELAQYHTTHGDIVVIIGRSETKLKQAVELLGSPSMLHIYPLAIQDNEAVRAFCAWIKIHFGRCDILYNNAGVGTFKPLVEMSIQEVKEMLEANINGVIYMTRAFLPMMLEQPSGHIVNIASLAGRVASAKASVYAATKAAIIRFSEGLRQEISNKNIHVLCVMPGPIDTPFLERADQSGQYRGKVESYLLSPAYVVKQIIRALEKRQWEVTLPFRLRLLSSLYQLCPQALKQILSPLINRK